MDTLVHLGLAQTSQILLTHGEDMASFGPLTSLSQAVPLVFQSTQMVGPDLRLLARIEGRDQF